MSQFSKIVFIDVQRLRLFTENYVVYILTIRMLAPEKGTVWSINNEEAMATKIRGHIMFAEC